MSSAQTLASFCSLFLENGISAALTTEAAKPASISCESVPNKQMAHVVSNWAETFGFCYECSFFCFLYVVQPLFICSKNHCRVLTQSLSICKAGDSLSASTATCGWVLVPHRHNSFKTLCFPVKISPISSPCMCELVALAGSQRVFVESLPAKAPPCQSVSQHLVCCLSHWI